MRRSTTLRVVLLHTSLVFLQIPACFYISTSHADKCFTSLIYPHFRFRLFVNKRRVKKTSPGRVFFFILPLQLILYHVDTSRNKETECLHGVSEFSSSDLLLNLRAIEVCHKPVGHSCRTLSRMLDFDHLTPLLRIVISSNE